MKTKGFCWIHDFILCCVLLHSNQPPASPPIKLGLNIYVSLLELSFQAGLFFLFQGMSVISIILDRLAFSLSEGESDYAQYKLLILVQGIPYPDGCKTGFWIFKQIFFLSIQCKHYSFKNHGVLYVQKCCLLAASVSTVISIWIQMEGREITPKSITKCLKSEFLSVVVSLEKEMLTLEQL